MIILAIIGLAAWVIVALAAFIDVKKLNKREEEGQ